MSIGLCTQNVFLVHCELTKMIHLLKNIIDRIVLLLVPTVDWSNDDLFVGQVKCVELSHIMDCKHNYLNCHTRADLIT